MLGSVEERVDTYDYTVPDELVAQEPAARREDARLLVVRGHGHELDDAHVPDLLRWLRPGDLLVFNDTHVRPARLTFRRSSGGRVTVLVLDVDGSRAEVLLGARGRLSEGELLTSGLRTWRLCEARGEGHWLVQDEDGHDVLQTVEGQGRMPLPPYIRRAPETDDRDALDRERYQTTFAGDGRSGFGAVAAPTAGLHFTPDLLERLGAHGVATARLRLDVGTGTFRPLRGETLDEHQMHVERFDVPDEVAESFARARAAGGRVVAVGTTVVRTLEATVAEDGRSLRAGPGQTRLFIRPGYHFGAVDAMITNFHQPRSTLLVLVSAFAGLETIQRAYAHAVEARYRFFSYGDAMLLR